MHNDSKRHGTQGEKLDLALLVDGLQAEREQGITIDVAYRYFSTEKRKFIIADTPGHEQYTRNMATGASTCDLAILLIDARKGVLDQTRRHSFISTLLGIKHLVVAVNKMDLVDYSEARFDEIRQSYLTFAEQLPGNLDIRFVPLSALEGDNVASQSANMPWYSGPTLLEDFILREKITHFDHERIPERIVHARGSAAHGYFQPYKSLKAITKADFLSDPNKITPVFVRFSTVQGGAGSADTVRDIRGFATKFYTEEGIFDLVGNNTPVFFIQDAHKFPDFVHAVKPEPHWAIPQGQSAHDTFWDYVSLQPETLHNVMWAMSDRGIPRSYRTMEGFGIHTFRLINAEGKATFVRFHWKPVAGKASLVWDEAQKLTGRDPDFHRRELWESIEAGDFPEYELGLQLIPEEDEFKFDFDLLDPTKLIPEELVPVQLVGKMVLNRNPDNFFAENEQAAFHPGHIVPGLDFTNDPLLQGRLFSYTDTQISRLGGPNFHEIPINRPTCPYHNFQRDGMHRQDIDTNPANYEPNSINDNWPRETPPGPKRGGFESYQERVDGTKIRERSPSFGEYYAQPRLFWNSQTPIE
ncbi:catalase, partial [Enterobacteriaceae bacterium TzEc013]|nr:catalase [Enterobacteriaceae bacterium TzEc013]